MARAMRSNNYCHPFERLAGAIRSETIANFSNCSSQSVEKTQDGIRAKKNSHQSFELVLAVPNNYSALCLATKLEVCFRVQQTLS